MAPRVEHELAAACGEDMDDVVAQHEVIDVMAEQLAVVVLVAWLGGGHAVVQQRRSMASGKGGDGPRLGPWRGCWRRWFGRRCGQRYGHSSRNGCPGSVARAIDVAGACRGILVSVAMARGSGEAVEGHDQRRLTGVAVQQGRAEQGGR